MSTTKVETLSIQGSGSSGIMIVLDCPQLDDMMNGFYLAGVDGAAFDRLIARAGLARNDLLITAAFNSPTVGGSASWLFEKGVLKPRNAALYMTNMLRLKKEIETHNPRVIIAMGDYALKALTGKGHWNNKKELDDASGERLPSGWSGLSDWRGSILPTIDIFKGRKVVAMQEISTIQKQWKLHAIWLNDLNRAVEQAKFPEIRRHPRKLIIDPPREQWDELAEKLLASPDPISFDIEHIHGKLLCIGFCAYSEWSLTIPHRGPESLAFYRRILESGHDLCAQNAMFDCSVLEWHEGIVTFPHLAYDTILAAHAANIELPKDLGMLASLYTEEPCYWDKSDWSGLGKTWTYEEMYEYNCLDAFVTHEIRREQLKYELDDPAVRATFEFEMSLLNPLWDISKRGILWSKEQVIRVRETAEQGLAAAMGALNMMYPDLAPLNVGSTQQMAKLLFDRLKVDESYGVFRDSTRSTNDLVLASISTNPRYRGTAIEVTIRLIREARKHRSMISKFAGDGTPDKGIQIDDDGRFRSTYVPSATDTGRLSAKIFFPTGKGANAQNQPRDTPVRQCFIPDPGYEIGYNDLERAESLVVAKITGDPIMLEHHLPGRNAHRLLGATLFNKAPEELDKDEYYLSKKTRHAGNYMQGWRTFMNNINKEADKTGIILNAAEAKKLIGLYREMHVGLGRWWKSVEYEVKQTRKLTNLFGRPRIFYGRIDAELPAAVAFNPQSTVGDAMNYAILNLWNAGIVGRPDSPMQMLAQIHDALVYQIRILPSPERLALLRRIREHMLIEIVSPYDNEPFTINTMPSMSTLSWGDCKEMSAEELGLLEAA